MEDNYISQRPKGRLRLRKDCIFASLKGGVFIYSNEEVQEMINCRGLKLIKYVNTKNVYAEDSEGYKYKFTLSNFKMGRKPSWIMKNPFALDNIKLYLSKNYPDYELLDKEYKTCKTKMRFICHRHEAKGIQYNTIDNIVNNNHTCKYCGYENLGIIKRISSDTAIKLCEERYVIYVGHYGKNHETYIQYMCPDHMINGIQEMSLTHFKSSKHPCKFCNISSGEFKVKMFLDEHNIPYKKEKTFDDCRNIKPLEFDFYLIGFDIIIEFDGRQHFEMSHWYEDDELNIEAFELLKKRDAIKNDYCKKNNIRLIRIPYWEYDNIDSILTLEISDVILMCKNTESSETAVA